VTASPWLRAENTLDMSGAPPEDPAAFASARGPPPGGRWGGALGRRGGGLGRCLGRPCCCARGQKGVELNAVGAPAGALQVELLDVLPEPLCEELLQGPRKLHVGFSALLILVLH